MSQSSVINHIEDIDRSNDLAVGVPSAKTADTAYYADTDGIVTSWPGAAGCTIYSDANSNPTTVVCTVSASVGGGGDYGMAEAPIVKGNYWKATGSSVYWISLGS